MRENSADELSGRIESRGAADLPKDVASLTPPLITTDEPGPVMRVLTVLKIQTSVAVPVRVSVPVNPAEDAKQ